MSAVTSTATVAAGTTSSEPAVRTVPLSRRLAIIGLVTGAALNTLEAVLAQFMPAIPDDTAERFEVIRDNQVMYAVGGAVGALAIPFLVLGVLATMQVLKPKVRKNAIAGCLLLLAGMWGFIAIHVFELAMLPAATSSNPAAAADMFTAIGESPWMGAVYFAPFILGVVLGIVTNIVAMLRSRVLALWIPLCYLGFVVLDFAVGAVGPIDPHFLYVAGAVGIAWHISKLSDRAWATGSANG